MVPYARGDDEKNAISFFAAKHSLNEQLIRASERVSEVKAMGDALSEGGNRADRVLRRAMRWWLVASRTLKRQMPRNVGKDDQQTNRTRNFRRKIR